MLPPCPPPPRYFHKNIFYLIFKSILFIKILANFFFHEMENESTTVSNASQKMRFYIYLCKSCHKSHCFLLSARLPPRRIKIRMCFHTAINHVIFFLESSCQINHPKLCVLTFKCRVLSTFGNVLTIYIKVLSVLRPVYV